MNSYFPEIRKNFGFGMMRLPMIGEDVDYDQTCAMVDAFLAAGFNYFDTARPYIQGKSELSIRDCLAARHSRESFLLANKLSGGCFETESDIRPFFESQLESCGVEYFDFYLMHAMSAKRHEFYQASRAYDIAQELKKEGKIRHVGMSFHDSAEVLDKILTDRPELEFVQLQLNYVDWDDPNVQSRACYEVCVKHGKPVIVMEPVKGGSLVNLPPKAAALLTGGSTASYAVRFAASHENVVMVLSGMSNTEQMDDNVATMGDFKPLSADEQEIIGQVRTIYQAQHRIPCTACRYCTDGCPAGIPIPDVFACMNDKRQENPDADVFACMNDKRQENPDADAKYAAIENKASACVECGQCENACPQNLHIRALLAEVAKTFGA